MDNESEKGLPDPMDGRVSGNGRLDIIPLFLLLAREFLAPCSFSVVQIPA